MAMLILRPLLFLGLFVILVSQTTAHQCNNANGNYTINSAYSANLETVLSNLISNTEIDYGFYNLSHGQNPDKVNALGMCRGDVKPARCLPKLPIQCDNRPPKDVSKSEGGIWMERMLHATLLKQLHNRHQERYA